MPTVDIPFFGTLVLSATLVAAAYTFAISVAAGRGRPQMLMGARYGAYATFALVALSVCLLAYAFQTHDFRIRYVARYSDRSMPWWYLVTSLWGGQDGSLLWWSFLLAGWSFVCVRWMRGRYLELQPWIIATLMSIMVFFMILMLYAANPFSVSQGVVPADGEGLNPLLQNYWMTIHPPTLYMGFVGWAVPFAIVVAALVTGRLHDEWIRAVRRWVLAAWLFLSIGLVLGMVWSYEELGWGGYWAWDPVENASFFPWLAGTAFLHSVMVQERYGMMKVYNVALLCFTYFLTIFGTFLTRSGLIASVHSFAKTDIGNYFVGYMLVLGVVLTALIVWRLPLLRSTYRIQSMLSREFAFLFNNWILLAMLFFVLIATIYPMISELINGETATVGPQFYNTWMVPFGLVFLFLAGVGPLISWRKATGKNLRKAFIWPTSAALLTTALHGFVGPMIGFPGIVAADGLYDTGTAKFLAMMSAVAPIASTTLCAFVMATIIQEFWRGTAVRMKNKGENPLVALTQLTFRARRRYGGYIVHAGMVMMYFGFTGAAYDIEKEAALKTGEVMDIGSYKVRYDQPRMESDPNKRMVFADMTLMDTDGNELDRMHPAKFIYRTHPEMPTTEVFIRMRPLEDVYVIMSTIDNRTKVGTFRVVVRPLVMWIWIGTMFLIFGTVLGASPSLKEILDTTVRRVPSSTGAWAAILLAIGLTLAPNVGYAQASSSSMAGTVEMHNDDERKLFTRALCMCGDCDRLTLSSCGCGWAERKRAEFRARMATGEEVMSILDDHRETYGAAAISIPSDKGTGRAMWAIPVALILMAVGGLFYFGNRRKNVNGGDGPSSGSGASGGDEPEAHDEYDDQLDAELNKMGEEL